jgi:mono/diheme cytochrome c family protein
MTNPANQKKTSPLREYAILVILILVGTPIALWWGARDGKALAVKAYGGVKDAEPAAAPDDDAKEEETGGKGAPVSTEESVARGAALFQANCVACHGAAADGKGPAAVAFTPPPRDFTDPKARWTNGREPAQIFASVSNGVAGTGMAGFAGALTDEQRWDLVHYLGSLPGAAGAP